MTALLALALAAALWIGDTPLASRSLAVPPPPADGILLIVLDDIGSENLSWWPQLAHVPNPPPTANLQAVAQAGVVFTGFHVQPLCSPTRAALLTGRSAVEHGLGAITSDPDFLSPAWTSLPRVLAQSGFTCAAFGKWHLGALDDLMHPIDVGFDLFSGTQANVAHSTSAPDDDHFEWWKVTATAAGATTERVTGTAFDESHYSLSVTGADARAWIQQQTGPWFAYVAFNVPHMPQQVPPHSMLSAASIAGLPPHFVAGYAGRTRPEMAHIFRLGIEALDLEIGRLLAVTTPGTTVVVLSDNGTPPIVLDENGPWAQHAKGTVYDAGTRVPLLVRGPLVQLPGTVCDELVADVDVRATIASIASAVIPPEPLGPGLDFKALIEDSSQSGARTYAFSQRFFPNGAYTPDLTLPVAKDFHDRGISDGQIHYLRLAFDPLAGTYTEEAYDLQADPFEVVNLLDPGASPTPEQLAAIDQLSTTMTKISGL